jgi:hypothetical protein
MRADQLEEWWQREYAKRKPLDKSYYAFTFNPDSGYDVRRKRNKNKKKSSTTDYL